MKVSKDFNFCAAHILSDYDGKCNNLHGHNYKLRITLEGDIIEDETSNEKGMVMDFGTLKFGVNEIIEHWDHAFIVDSSSKKQIDLVEYLQDNGLCTRFYYMNGRTTAENMIKVIVEKVTEQLMKDKIENIKGVFGKLWETPTSSVTYEKIIDFDWYFIDYERKDENG
jgi:6-pyruvoyltetrahydropterin/6-carboxytetrahydropterin synthase